MFVILKRKDKEKGLKEKRRYIFQLSSSDFVATVKL
jgi:hypothetical protein